ncbi:MAG: ABC transporter ATP-binding protein [Deferribacterales bacterium]|nr:ABC transporter ATP-binding protein [Deferribacterales bacterium]
MDNLVTLDSVSKFFTASGGMFKSGSEFAAVDNLSLNILKGRSLGIVGESGSGKTTTARMICDIYKPDKGKIFYKDRLINSLGNDYESYRKNVQMVFQDPYNSLNPKLTVRSALSDGIKQYITKDLKEINERVCFLMKMVGLSEEYLDRYPHEFSGGQRQRISIARALSLEPELIIADEPVSSLDVSVQAQILNLMKGLKEGGVTFILISHSLATVSFLCDDIAVMYKGKLVEYGETIKVLESPKSNYTMSLLNASLYFEG